MIYPYDKKNNKKLLWMYLFAGLCVLAGASTFIFTTPLFGIICTAVGCYVAWQVIRAMRKFLSSRIETYSEGFTVYMTTGNKLSFEWGNVTHSGIIMNGPSKDYVFAYALDADSIVQLPPVFVNFEEFKTELMNHTPYKEYVLEDGETIIDYLKHYLGFDKNQVSDEKDETND